MKNSKDQYRGGGLLAAVIVLGFLAERALPEPTAAWASVRQRNQTTKFTRTGADSRIRRQPQCRGQSGPAPILAVARLSGAIRRQGHSPLDQRQ
jgi:hypothetical protein